MESLACCCHSLLYGGSASGRCCYDALAGRVVLERLFAEAYAVALGEKCAERKVLEGERRKMLGRRLGRMEVNRVCLGAKMAPWALVWMSDEVARSLRRMGRRYGTASSDEVRRKLERDLPAAVAFCRRRQEKGLEAAVSIQALARGTVSRAATKRRLEIRFEKRGAKISYFWDSEKLQKRTRAPLLLSLQVASPQTTKRRHRALDNDFCICKDRDATTRNAAKTRDTRRDKDLEALLKLHDLHEALHEALLFCCETVCDRGEKIQDFDREEENRRIIEEERKLREDLAVFYKRYGTSREHHIIEDMLRDLLDDADFEIKGDFSLEEVTSLALASQRRRRARLKAVAEAERSDNEAPRATVSFAKPAVRPFDGAFALADVERAAYVARERRKRVKEIKETKVDWSQSIATCFTKETKKKQQEAPILSFIEDVDDDLAAEAAVAESLCVTQADEALTLLLLSRSARRAIDDALPLATERLLPLPIKVTAHPPRASAIIKTRCFFNAKKLLIAASKCRPGFDDDVIVDRLLRTFPKGTPIDDSSEKPQFSKNIVVDGPFKVPELKTTIDDEVVLLVADVFVDEAEVIIEDIEVFRSEDLGSADTGFFDLKTLMMKKTHENLGVWREEKDVRSFKCQHGDIIFEYRCRGSSHPEEKNLDLLRRSALRWAPVATGTLDAAPVILEKNSEESIIDENKDDDGNLSSSSSDEEESRNDNNNAPPSPAVAAATATEVELLRAQFNKERLI